MDWMAWCLGASTALLATLLPAGLRRWHGRRALPSSPAPQPPQRFVVLAPGGLPQGPIDRATLRAMLIDGRLDENALAAAIAGDGWHPAAELALAEDDPTALADPQPSWRR